MATEVRRGLVSADGARRYGVVVNEDGVLDAPGTDALRTEIRSGRVGELPVFDMGPGLAELLEAAARK